MSTTVLCSSQRQMQFIRFPLLRISKLSKDPRFAYGQEFSAFLVHSTSLFPSPLQANIEQRMQEQWTGLVRLLVIWRVSVHLDNNVLRD